MINLFGFPVYKTSLLNEQYNRSELIKTINHNYDLDNNRNSWDNDWSDLHHSVDDNNDKFKSLDYSHLLPTYEKNIVSFIELPIKKTVASCAFFFVFKYINKKRKMENK